MNNNKDGEKWNYTKNPSVTGATLTFAPHWQLWRDSEYSNLFQIPCILNKIFSKMKVVYDGTCDLCKSEDKLLMNIPKETTKTLNHAYGLNVSGITTKKKVKQKPNFFLSLP